MDIFNVSMFDWVVLHIGYFFLEIFFISDGMFVKSFLPYRLIALFLSMIALI